MKPTLQSSLGNVVSNSTRNDRVWALGSLCFGEVLKVHSKRYTADVRIYGSNAIISSSASQEGAHSCRIGVSNAGFDTKFKKPFGEIVPIQKGSIVLVGFLNNSKEKPVILRVFHNISEQTGQYNRNNILSSTYTVADDTELNRYLSISRIQDFKTIDGDGNFEISSHTKSFIVGINNKEIDEETFDYEDLSIKNPDRSTIGVAEENSKPLKFLAVFRDHFLDTKTNWLRIIIDPLKTVFKIAKIQQLANTLSMMEIDKDGTIKLKRQLDTKSFEDSNQYSEISIKSTGEIEIKTEGEQTSLVRLSNKGLEIKTSNNVSIESNSDINLKSNTLNISGDVVITGSLTTPQS